MAGALCLAAGHVRRGVLSARPSSHAHPHTDTDPAAPPSLAETDPGYPLSLAETDPRYPLSLAETDLGYPFLGEQTPWFSYPGGSWFSSPERKQILAPPSLAETDLGYPFLGKQIL
jgi:hypothetical protein